MLIKENIKINTLSIHKSIPVHSPSAREQTHFSWWKRPEGQNVKANPWQSQKRGVWLHKGASPAVSESLYGKWQIAIV